MSEPRSPASTGSLHLGHLDEHGQPCTRHRPNDDVLLAWATVGSRIAGYHHDSASKLQSLMMALDEAADVLEGENTDARRALATATTSLRELHGLLTENRALAKAPQRKVMPLADLLNRAAARIGVKLTGELGTSSVFVAAPSIVHALALLFDHVGGALKAARVVDVTVTTVGADMTVGLAGASTDEAAPSMNEAIAVAAFLLAREDGALRCTPRGFVVQLPMTARSAGDKP